MSKRFRISLLLLILAGGVLLAWGAASAAPAISERNQSVTTVATPTPLPIQQGTLSPEISLIDSPSASCTQTEPHTGVCTISWYYMYANADPNYVITMTVGIDGEARARYTGFFQKNMLVPAELLSFHVRCGGPGEGGDPQFGATHSYVLRARDSSGLSAANYGSVTCPADTLHSYLPVLRR